MMKGPTPAISVLRKLKVILLEPLALPADVHALCLMKIIGSGNTSAKHCRDYGAHNERRRCRGRGRLRWSCSRVGRSESRGRCRSWSEGHCKGDPRSPQHESAARVRLPRLRLARPETYFLVRVLREWGQSRCMGSNGQTDDARIFRDPYGRRTLELAGFRPGE